MADFTQLTTICKWPLNVSTGRPTRGRPDAWQTLEQHECTEVLVIPNRGEHMVRELLELFGGGAVRVPEVERLRVADPSRRGESVVSLRSPDVRRQCDEQVDDVVFVAHSALKCDAVRELDRLGVTYCPCWRNRHSSEVLELDSRHNKKKRVGHCYSWFSRWSVKLPSGADIPLGWLDAVASQKLVLA